MAEVRVIAMRVAVLIAIGLAGLPQHRVGE
jgi:hypothetical protein